ncbi:MAG TPA: LysM domain-containing protein [Solirubrobacterales bacterium]|nr:LysM domain-containing protein [Solirubrobacterales bacterium]
MNKRTSASARVLAVTALVVALVVAIVAISGALGGGDSNGSGSGKHGAKQTHKTHHKHVPATYEIEYGDTLISIAHHTGVPVRTIEKLNPEIDPQILVAGEELKLR